MFKVLYRIFFAVEKSRPARHSRQARRPATRVVRAPAPRAPSSQARSLARPTTLCGKCYVIDGDTIVIKKTKIRLAGIDAPELDHPYGNKSKWAMVALCKGQMITAHIKDEMSHDRLVARCCLPDGRDLAEELVKQGLAIDWPKYSGGRYTPFETPDARKLMWRADARQKGRMRY